MEMIQSNATNTLLSEAQINFILKNLIEFLIKDSIPFYTLKSPNFQKFIHSLNPQFKIPNPNLIKESITHLYNISFDEIRNKLLNTCQFASLTTDFWTASHQKKGYMGITCSWLSESFEPIETLLNLFYVPHPHTNLTIKNLLVEEISKWGLEEKITAITTDNGSNMVSGSRLLKETLNIERISCAAHTLQLCIKKALNCDDNIKALVLRARRLVLFFNSPKQLEALFKQQQRSSEDYPEKLRPIYDVATRWNSTYNSWVRLLFLKKAIVLLQANMMLDNDPEIKKDGRKLYKLLLADSEWELIKRLVEILRQFDTVTTTLSGRDFVTLSLVTPLIFFLKNKFLELIDMYDEENNNDFQNEIIEPIDSSELLEEGDEVLPPLLEETNEDEIELFEENNGERRRRKINISRPVNSIGLYEKIISTLYNSLNHYWSTPSSLAAFASALDPRFKALTFFSNDRRNEILNSLKDQYNLLKQQQEEEQIINPIQSRSVRLPLRRTSFGDQNNVFDDLFDNLQQFEQEQGEFEKYFNLPTASRTVDPFLWWNERKNELPIMSKLARKYLCMSATSVPSERLFSDVGNHITPSRNRLSPDFVSKIIFLKRNSREINVFNQSV
jgi:hypothetical protein